MFCKNCGKEIEDDVKFCPACGTSVEAGAQASDSDSPGKNAANDSVKETIDFVSSGIENTNPLCIVGLVLTFLMFFFNYYCIVGFAAFVFSLLGYRAAKNNGQKGAVLAIVCMVVSGTASLIFVGYLIEYKRYESAVYGGINGILDLLGL